MFVLLDIKFANLCLDHIFESMVRPVSIFLGHFLDILDQRVV